MEFEPQQRLHRPYASMNWIRFNGSLRSWGRQGRLSRQQYLSPLSGPPWWMQQVRHGSGRPVKALLARLARRGVKRWRLLFCACTASC